MIARALPPDREFCHRCCRVTEWRPIKGGQALRCAVCGDRFPCPSSRCGHADCAQVRDELRGAVDPPAPPPVWNGPPLAPAEESPGPGEDQSPGPGEGGRATTRSPEDSTTPTKTCKRCARDLPAAAFWRDKSQADGLYPWCKECDRARREEKKAK